jgi:hypothetical protein
MSVPEKRKELTNRIGEYGLHIWRRNNLQWLQDADPYLEAVLEAIDAFEDAVREQEARAHELPDVSH